MKLKFYIITLLLASSVIVAQNRETDLYQVSLFKRLHDKSVAVKIDSLGNLYKNNIATGQKIDINSFNIAIHKLAN